MGSSNNDKILLVSDFPDPLGPRIAVIPLLDNDKFKSEWPYLVRLALKEEKEIYRNFDEGIPDLAEAVGNDFENEWPRLRNLGLWSNQSPVELYYDELVHSLPEYLESEEGRQRWQLIYEMCDHVNGNVGQLILEIGNREENIDNLTEFKQLLVDIVAIVKEWKPGYFCSEIKSGWI